MTARSLITPEFVRFWSKANYYRYLPGDNGYSFCKYKLTPILSPTSDKERRYNTALTKARNFVERRVNMETSKRGLHNLANLFV